MSTLTRCDVASDDLRSVVASGEAERVRSDETLPTVASVLVDDWPRALLAAVAKPREEPSCARLEWCFAVGSPLLPGASRPAARAVVEKAHTCSCRRFGAGGADRTPRAARGATCHRRGRSATRREAANHPRRTMTALQPVLVHHRAPQVWPGQRSSTPPRRVLLHASAEASSGVRSATGGPSCPACTKEGVLRVTHAKAALLGADPWPSPSLFWTLRGDRRVCIRCTW